MGEPRPPVNVVFRLALVCATVCGVAMFLILGRRFFGLPAWCARLGCWLGVGGVTVAALPLVGAGILSLRERVRPRKHDYDGDPQKRDT